MQGLSRSTNTFDLNLIFFKIRETRDLKTRRSWQRRARLALALRDDLSPAERHEICSVWSQRNVHQIDSPALSKLHGKAHAPRPEQTISAKSFTRRSTGVKKPSIRGLIAANDDVFSVDCSVSRSSPALDSDLQHRAIYKPQHALSQSALILFQGYIYQRLPRGNGEPSFSSDNRSNQPRRRGRKPERCKKPIKTTLNIIICNSRLILSKKPTFPKARNELETLRY
jgi:hypothetical protein